MRWPLVVVIAVKWRRCWAPLPIPVILCWPLIAALLLAHAVGRQLQWRQAAGAQALLLVLGSLPGLRIDVTLTGRCRFWLWIM